jgi:hypothetical protein
MAKAATSGTNRSDIAKAVWRAIESRKERVKNGKWDEQKSRDEASYQQFQNHVAEGEQETLRKYGTVRYKG